MESNPPPVLSRHARALQILNCLQSGPRFNARELANRFQVSRRTIYRDLSLMREAGVPVVFDESFDAYRLASKSRFVEPPRFDEDDLTALIMVSQLSLLQGVPEYANRVNNALSKLLVLSPMSSRLDAMRLLNACVSDLPSVRTRNFEVYRQILSAIRQQRRLKVLLAIKKEDGDEVTRGTIWTRFAPYRLLISDTSWRVIGHSSIHRRNRCFDLEQMERAEMTDDLYLIPRGFRSRH